MKDAAGRSSVHSPKIEPAVSKSPAPSRPAPSPSTAAAASNNGASAGLRGASQDGDDATNPDGHARSLSSGPSQPQHKRVYQACIPCRRRKVRCDLGSVDNPHDPPCMRCRRESKECFFSATRRKRKNDDDQDEYADEYIVRNGRKRHYLEGSPPLGNPAADDPDDSTTFQPVPLSKPFQHLPLTPGGSTGQTQPLRRSHGLHDARDPSRDAHNLSPADTHRNGYTGPNEDSNANAQLENLEAQNVMRKGVYGPHDALDLLYKAATDSPHSLQVHQEAVPSANIAPTPIPPSLAPPPGRRAARGSLSGFGSRPQNRAASKPADPIDPRLLPCDSFDDENLEVEARVSVEHEPGYREAMKAWARFRFVRAGWFTKEEAVKYIVYYYEYLSPMTPVSPPTFRSPGSHPTLLEEEPILAVTLLTIASRYYSIRTTGGHCRSHAIHEELWRYLRRMVERCLWGQEAFGGGFCGSGADESQTSSTAPWRGLRKGSLRTLGTVESLMILTEWHPRALHFPPEEAIDELMLPAPVALVPDTFEDDVVSRPGGSVGGQRIESWLEPAWRSDRMCWMLLSNALGLAYELGVFDDIDELLAANAITRPEYEDESYRLRAMRIKRLLLIYITQLAGRLGWTNMVPESIRKTDPVFSASQRRPMTGNEGTTPGTNPSVMSNTTFNYVPDVELDDQIIQCWVGVSNAMHLGNERLFKSRKHTTEIIQSGAYTRLLKEFQPILKEWWREFERFRLPEFIRHILTIEYEYVRIYVNSLALQAVVERCTTNATAGSAAGNGDGHGLGPLRGMNGNGNGSGITELSPQTQNYLGNLPIGHLGRFGAADQECVKEVVSGCRSLLGTVVDGLFKNGYLKHAPVRTYFRIISGAMFLLKTFALGAPKSDVETSISLLDRTVHALRTCVVDDIHLGTRFGDLLESLTTRLRDRFKFAPLSSVDGVRAMGGMFNGDGMSRMASAAGMMNGQAGGGGGAGGLMGGGMENGGFKFAVPERTSTPSGISATPFDLSSSNFPFPAGSAAMFGAVNFNNNSNNPNNQNGNNDPNNNNSTNNSSNGIMDPNNMSSDHNNIFGNHDGAGGGGGGGGIDWSTDEMWYLPPGAGLFQNIGGGENSNVTMTDQGVNVGGVDLLEFMAMDPPTFEGMDGF
ncbi:transcriptional activator ARO80 [Astrocystis sublimbata]|nr:transcriptional activator ARO80 [Astrocystis sublimbata]